MPVVMRGPAWTHHEVTDRLHRGSHKSTHEQVDFVCDKIADFANKGFWTVLPYKLAKHLCGLRLSPLGCVPQRGQQPRLIVNLLYYSINADTLKLAPHKAMQFGRALDRLLYRIQHATLGTALCAHE
jgi:hypothetical protein